MEEQSLKIPDANVKDGIIDFIAGSLGGTALVYVGQPLDTIKVKMQTFPTLYNNMINCFVKTYKADGIYKGLYAGTVPALVANITENSVLFMCYGLCQKTIQQLTGTKKTEDLSIFANASAGFFASFFSSIALTPTELVKCRLQAMYEVNKQMLLQGKNCERVGPFALTSNIFKNEGVPGLFRGLVPTLVREMPGYFFFFGGYEASREFFRKEKQSKDDIGLWRTMVSGANGGLIFWSITYPIDVAKSRIQVSNSNENMFYMLGRIFRQEGMGALYSGLAPTLVRTIPATAALFVTYEYSKKAMHSLF